MPRKINVDVQRLYELWANPELTQCEIARDLQVTQGFIGVLARRHKLPRRALIRRAFSCDDPTPEQIAERARECREKHFAARRAEA